MQISTKNIENEKARNYYSKSGLMTDVEKYADELIVLSPDIGQLCELIHGLLIHYQTGDLYGVQLPATRMDEVRTRFVSRIFDNILRLNPRPLTIVRFPQERHIGCCRDFATLLCSLLRLKGRPARVRVGFANYVEPTTDVYCDHWITEYWSDTALKWVQVDPQQDTVLREHNQLAFDPLDIPDNQFVLAGVAWLLCRRGYGSPTRYGYGPTETGMWIIRNNLLHDMASLNKIEMTPWDSWGFSDQPYEDLTEEMLSKLDAAAELTIAVDDSFTQTRTFYERETYFRVPAKVTSYTLRDERTTAVIYE